MTEKNEPNTDMMAVCDRFLCKFNCPEKQHFCTANCIHIDHSGKCTTFEIDAEAREKLKATIENGRKTKARDSL